MPISSYHVVRAPVEVLITQRFAGRYTNALFVLESQHRLAVSVIALALISSITIEEFASPLTAVRATLICARRHTGAPTFDLN